MSMISAQIDELRQMADGQATFHDARAVMLEAADTIWQLRDDLQRANAAVQDAEHDESIAWDRVRKAEAENAKLREERDMYRDLVDCMVHPDVPDQLAAENAKLHELVRDVWHLFTEHGAVHPCDLPVVDAVRDRMRELGVEVDE